MDVVKDRQTYAQQVSRQAGRQSHRLTARERDGGTGRKTIRQETEVSKYMYTSRPTHRLRD